MASNFSEILVLALLGFSSFYPLFFILTPRNKIDAGFYNFNLGLAGILGSIGLMLLWVAGVELSVIGFVCAWIGIHLVLTAMYWNAEKIPFLPLLLSSLLGIAVFWIVFEYFHPGMAASLTAITLFVGNGIVAGVFFAMILGHWYLNVIQLPIRFLKNTTISLFVLIGARMIIDLYGLVTQSVLSPFGTSISLLEYAASFEGFFIALAMFFGILVPLILNVMIWRTVQLQSTQSATGLLYVSCVSVLFGDLFYRYCLMSSGLVL
jgi:hypothetical protein